MRALRFREVTNFAEGYTGGMFSSLLSPCQLLAAVVSWPRGRRGGGGWCIWNRADVFPCPNSSFCLDILSGSHIHLHSCTHKLTNSPILYCANYWAAMYQVLGKVKALIHTPICQAWFAFSMIQSMLAIWSLVPLPFLNPACTSGRSQCCCSVN